MVVNCIQIEYIAVIWWNEVSENFEEKIETAVQALKTGNVVVLPTDTLYGLTANALDVVAVEKIFTIKKRPAGMALPLLLADPMDLTDWCRDIPELAWKLVETLWPGPLSVILYRADAIPDVVAGKGDTIAVRIPDHPVPREVVRRLGAPITGTSANISGQEPPLNIDSVREHLGEHIDYFIGEGNLPMGVPSTIIDLTRPVPLVVRQGAVSLNTLHEILGVAIDFDQ